MARPKKHPESLVRLQPYLQPRTAAWLAFEAAKTNRPIGEILDELINERIDHPDDPVVSKFDFTGPLTEPEWAPKKSAAGHIPTIGAPKPPKPAVKRDHTWRVNSNNVNVCVDCGGKKMAVKNKPCPGPKENP